MKSGKIWGQTELIHANGVLEFHRIEFKKGYACSEHKHAFKWNGFFVESGKMLVRVWQEDQGLVDETILEAGDFTQVKPGKYHQCFWQSNCMNNLYLPEKNTPQLSDAISSIKRKGITIYLNFQ
jgi:quercetin dioxygenase-like cupin family protein